MCVCADSNALTHVDGEAANANIRLAGEKKRRSSTSFLAVIVGVELRSDNTVHVAINQQKQIH